MTPQPSPCTPTPEVMYKPPHLPQTPHPDLCPFPTDRRRPWFRLRRCHRLKQGGLDRSLYHVVILSSLFETKTNPSYPVNDPSISRDKAHKANQGDNGIKEVFSSCPDWAWPHHLPLQNTAWPTMCDINPTTPTPPASPLSCVCVCDLRTVIGLVPASSRSSRSRFPKSVLDKVSPERNGQGDRAISRRANTHTYTGCVY
jgi:hypothetical protein